MIGLCNGGGLCSLDLGADVLCVIWTNVSLRKIKLKVFPACIRPRDSLCPLYPFAYTTSIVPYAKGTSSGVFFFLTSKITINFTHAIHVRHA